VQNTVPVGGYIFESYLYTHSAYDVNQRFKQYVVAAQFAGRTNILEWQNEELLETCHNHFLGFLLYSLSSIGSNGNQQFFYHTLCCNFHGLSRKGQEYLSRLGFASKLRSFDETRSVCISKSREIVRSTLYQYK